MIGDLQIAYLCIHIHVCTCICGVISSIVYIMSSINKVHVHVYWQCLDYWPYTHTCTLYDDVNVPLLKQVGVSTAAFMSA